MVVPWDIYATAKLILDQHGPEGAANHCLDRMEVLKEAGDDQGAYVWGQVRAALLDLSDIRLDGDPIN
ncbi:MAG TPA: hypothetical protein DCG48_04015 [Rhodospirillaceae bacterium]|nr:hypothetical protein [Rhodospirillaceae bacterium]|tara:strand:+ start:6512 stop:6715 length:204 start_codon:yes stop_codon:yes gene_type:complete